jgi:branched-chain amino acid transport system ATP-binding protein
MLRAIDIFAGYGQVEVLRGVTLELELGELVCLLGANGAGKSTLLKTISGILTPRIGKVLFKDKEIQRKRPEEIVRLGISQVPEGRQIFSTLTVRQNLLLGSYARRKTKNDLNETFDIVFGLFGVLKKKLTHKAGSLSGGEQQMLAIGRSLMSKPKVLLLDEPSLGIAPIIVKGIFEIIERLRSEGISILIVEQNAGLALQVASRGYVMEVGGIVKHGNARDLLEDDEVRRRYLGR